MLRKLLRSFAAPVQGFVHCVNGFLRAVDHRQEGVRILSERRVDLVQGITKFRHLRGER